MKGGADLRIDKVAGSVVIDYRPGARPTLAAFATGAAVIYALANKPSKAKEGEKRTLPIAVFSTPPRGPGRPASMRASFRGDQRFPVADRDGDPA